MYLQDSLEEFVYMLQRLVSPQIDRWPTASHKLNRKDLLVRTCSPQNVSATLYRSSSRRDVYCSVQFKSSQSVSNLLRTDFQHQLVWTDKCIVAHHIDHADDSRGRPAVFEPGSTMNRKVTQSFDYLQWATNQTQSGIIVVTGSGALWLSLLTPAGQNRELWVSCLPEQILHITQEWLTDDVQVCSEPCEQGD